MEKLLTFIIVCSLFTYKIGHPIENDGIYTKTLKMVNAVSERKDDLVCHAEKLDSRESYIVKYVPDVSDVVVHHMMVYGCRLPGNHNSNWACPSMDDSSENSVCANGSREIVYAWALNASSKSLPKDVGFRVSGSTDIHDLILQMHYKDKFPDGVTDSSGVILHMTPKPQLKQAGYYVLGTTGYVPGMVTNYHLDTACQYFSNTIYPIAYRTHSHQLGVVTSGYRIRNGTWTEIGRMSPQAPETFYEITNPGMNIKYGDILASRCTMTSNRTEITNIGPTNQDEMCNFYIMYYTYKKETIHLQSCFLDPQVFHWENFFKNIPENAGSLDGVKYTQHALNKS